jgi:hypothetical protein
MNVTSAIVAIVYPPTDRGLMYYRGATLPPAVVVISIELQHLVTLIQPQPLLQSCQGLVIGTLAKYYTHTNNQLGLLCGLSPTISKTYQPTMYLCTAT